MGIGYELQRANRTRLDVTKTLDEIGVEVTVADLETIRAQDVSAAVRDACAEKHVPLNL